MLRWGCNDCRDETAQRLTCRLYLRHITRQRLAQVGNAASIALGKVGHQRHRRLSIEICQFASVAVALGHQRRHHFADLIELPAAIGDGKRQALYPAVGLGHAFLQRTTGFLTALTVRGHAVLILFDIRRYRVGLEHALAQCPQHATFENVIGDAAIVAAGACLPARGASPLVASDDRVGTTTRTELDKPAQQAFGAPLAFRSQADRVAEPCRGRRPALLVDDGQLGYAVVTHCSRGLGRATRLRVMGSRTKLCRL